MPTILATGGVQQDCLNRPVPRSMPSEAVLLPIDELISQRLAVPHMKCYDIPLENFEYRDRKGFGSKNGVVSAGPDAHTSRMH